MVNRLAYCIDSPHYYHHFNFLSSLHWLAQNNAHASILTTGNLALQSIVDQLGDPLNKIIRAIPLAPLDRVATIRPDELYSNLEPHFPNFPQEDLSIITTIAPDRCVGYVYTHTTKTIAEALVQESNFSDILILGSGTDSPINNYPIIKQALSKNFPIIGFPFGNVTGRYAPFWLKYCRKIYVSSDSAFQTLLSTGHNENTLVRYEPTKLNIQHDSSAQGKIVIDVGIHSARHELVRLIQSIIKYSDPKDIFIQTNQSTSFVDFLGKYLAVHNIPQISIGNKLEEVFAAKHLFCLFPFACKHFLENFSTKIPTSIVDFQGRYSKIDGLKFSDSRIITHTDKIMREDIC